MIFTNTFLKSAISVQEDWNNFINLLRPRLAILKEKIMARTNQLNAHNVWFSFRFISRYFLAIVTGNQQHAYLLVIRAKR